MLVKFTLPYGQQAYVNLEQITSVETWYSPNHQPYSSGVTVGQSDGKTLNISLHVDLFLDKLQAVGVRVC